MAKKLVVPQSGTTPAPSPLDNMLHASAAPVAAPVVAAAQKVSNKKRTSINLDENIYTDFKVYCAKNGKSISGLIEEAMVNIMNGR
ncbi:MAG: plasmid partition protein ParG [Prevotella sp.]|nr:plasmid partition protein ParG [Prevotella sp.]